MTKRRLADAHAALRVTDLAHRVGPVIPTSREPITARYQSMCQMSGCGQTIREGDKIYVAARVNYTTGETIQGGLWVHVTCPTLYDSVDWLQTHEYDSVVRMITDCLPQKCRRCGQEQDAVTIYAVIDYPHSNNSYVCVRCVRL